MSREDLIEEKSKLVQEFVDSLLASEETIRGLLAHIIDCYYCRDFFDLIVKDYIKILEKRKKTV